MIWTIDQLFIIGGLLNIMRLLWIIGGDSDDVIIKLKI